MKRMSIAAAAVTVVAVFASAAPLEYYSDEVHYKPARYDGFAGFGSWIKARCHRSPVVLLPREKAPEDASLSEVYERFRDSKAILERTEAELKMLEKAAEEMEYENADARQVISNTAALAERKVNIGNERRLARLRYDAALKQLSAAGQNDRLLPMYLAVPCEAPELIVPSYKLSIRPRYRATIDEANEKITVEEVLELQNRSGVDIRAEKGVFHTYPLHESLRRLEFRPWVINRPSVRARSKAMAAEDAMPVMAAVSASAPAAKRVNDKTYTLEHLDLPADGSKVVLPVSETTLPVETQRVVYPFLDTRVFMTYLFEPKTRVMSPRWQVSAGDTVSDSAFGEYEKNRYRLYVSVDRDVRVRRKRDIHADSQGFFTGAKIKDGYTVELTNLSDRLKPIRVIERIPVSTTDRIEVTDLRISPSDLPYKRGKEGKLTFMLTLLPHATRVIHVGFTVKHDRDVPVRY